MCQIWRDATGESTDARALRLLMLRLRRFGYDELETMTRAVMLVAPRIGKVFRQL